MRFVCSSLSVWFSLAVAGVSAFADSGRPDDPKLPDSVPTLVERKVYDALSNPRLIPGFSPTDNVKFVIELKPKAGGGPKLYFLNTRRYNYHENFIVKVLKFKGSHAEWERVTYKNVSDRRYLVGNIVYYAEATPPGGTQKGLYTIEFYEIDEATVDDVAKAYAQILPLLPPTVADKEKGVFFFRPTQVHLADVASKLATTHPEVKVLTNNQLFAGLDHLVMHAGEAYGYLRYISAEELKTNPEVVHRLGSHAIPVFEAMPLDIGVVAGTITEGFQNPLSHLNLKANERGTPNLVVPKAKQNSVIGPILRAQDKPGAKPILVHMRLINNKVFLRTDEPLEVAQKFWASKKPNQIKKLSSDVKEQAFLASFALEKPSVLAPNYKSLDFTKSGIVGSKAANFGELGKLFSGLKLPVVRKGFGIPFYYFEQHIVSNGLDKVVTDMLQDPKFKAEPQNDEEWDYRNKRLTDLQESIRTAPINPQFIQRIRKFVDHEFPKQNVKFRSSTNSEDLAGFNGAGLYESLAYKWNPKKPEEAAKTPEQRLAEAIRGVWASVWNIRAFEEREIFGMPHADVKMGLLVTASFSDEEANGVVITRNIFNPKKRAFYINTQVGEHLVTNPEAGETPEQLMVYFKMPVKNETVPPSLLESAKLYFDFIQYTNLDSAGNILPEGTINTKSILSLDAKKPSGEVVDLARYLYRAHVHFAKLYGRDPLTIYEPSPFALDLEFKLERDAQGRGQIYLKQARPYSPRGDSAENQ